MIKGRDDRRAGLARLVGFRAGRIDFNFKRFAVIASWIKRGVGRNAIFELK